MNPPGLDALRVVLDDLLEAHLEDLQKLRTADLYLPTLREDRARLLALQQGQPEDQSVLHDLDETDRDHDDFGWAIWHICEAHRRCPLISDKTRQAARLIQAAFVPEISELRDHYAQEAARAQARRPEVERLGQALAMIPVADGQTLKTWVEGFLDKGTSLGELLRQREEVRQATHMTLRRLRRQVMSTLEDLRTAVRLEVKRNPELDPDFETRVFSTLDQHLPNRNA